MNGNHGQKSRDWIVYILRCSDKSLYTGITNNITNRLAAHNQGTGAKYTRSRRPVTLMAISSEMQRSDAMRLELKVKKMSPEKKIAALEKQAGKKTEQCLPVGKTSKAYNRKTLKDVSGFWQIQLKKLHRHIPIQGSPERSLFRVVLEDQNGSFFILEQIAPGLFEQKKKIATTVDFLARQNLARIQPCLISSNGGFFNDHGDKLWQMIPFIKGVDLDREKYVFDKWRGHALAAFLVELRSKSQKLSPDNSCGTFSLKKYVYKLVNEINLYNKDIKEEINHVVDFLEKDFMSAYEKLPVAFCHGDYHPLNVIWSADDIIGVLDWEFCGFKSDLYDAANLIGCVGVEDPHSLRGDLVKSFISDLKKAKIISPKSWRYMVEFIVALRFAWLAEWLRRNDTEMIRLELDYMSLLIDNKTILQKAWL